MSDQKVGLIILDGWGIGDGSSRDAIASAKTPVMHQLLANYPHTTLTTSGEQVGLPDGQMGNSEVGHLNIGAGRVVYQELTRINKSIREGEFFELPMLKKAFETAKATGRKLHFMGLVSNGGVHSSQDHLHALCTMAHNYGLTNVYIHAFTDGRDCDPKSGAAFLTTLEMHLAATTGRIATIVGRYYAMDRDNRWERVKVAYDAMVRGTGMPFETAGKAMEDSYANEVTDEFVQPYVLFENGIATGRIEPGDTVISFNFRTDRPREISQALTQRSFPEYGMEPLAIAYYTMTNYDHTFRKVNVIFDKDNLQNTLGEILGKMGRTQVRIAETEKYPHVTFFFSGGREKEFPGESRILINSPKVATYDLQPEMSAIEIKNRIIEAMDKQSPDFFCLNFANPDMVGHTGIFEAIVKAVETVDACLGEIVAKAQQLGYELLVIADHGNADVAKNLDGTPNTAHSLNPVPAVLVTNDACVELSPGILADVAPTILSRMRIAAPLEMTGKSLVKMA
jgi:2,3-bisphosphoglycerate-independent phosphoglycerate mutase